jgi:asparagine synthetase B (glutamine-hydrolysing)
VLLSGLGADEQLAGYSRHRTTFQIGGWKALEDELAMEMNRISKRNLGRDDR